MKSFGFAILALVGLSFGQASACHYGVGVGAVLALPYTPTQTILVQPVQAVQTVVQPVIQTQAVQVQTQAIQAVQTQAVVAPVVAVQPVFTPYVSPVLFSRAFVNPVFFSRGHNFIRQPVIVRQRAIVHRHR